MKPATTKQNQINKLRQSSTLQPATPPQGVLDLGIEIERDVNGIEMGVLENGVPFLTQRGLAEITGIARKEIYDITQQWEQHYDDKVLTKDRLSFIKEYLFRNGYSERKLYIETRKDGTPHYAYPDIVCMAFESYCSPYNFYLMTNIAYEFFFFPFTNGWRKEISSPALPCAFPIVVAF